MERVQKALWGLKNQELILHDGGNKCTSDFLVWLFVFFCLWRSTVCVVSQGMYSSFCSPQ